jgi:hypothetical protein
MRGARPANDARAAARFRSHDPRWVKHKGKRAVHGFEAHVGADADTALVEGTLGHIRQYQRWRSGP